MQIIKERWSCIFLENGALKKSCYSFLWSSWLYRCMSAGWFRWSCGGSEIYKSKLHYQENKISLAHSRLLFRKQKASAKWPKPIISKSLLWHKSLPRLPNLNSTAWCIKSGPLYPTQSMIFGVRSLCDSKATTLWRCLGAPVSTPVMWGLTQWALNTPSLSGAQKRELVNPHFPFNTKKEACPAFSLIHDDVNESGSFLPVSFICCCISSTY